MPKRYRKKSYGRRRSYKRRRFSAGPYLSNYAGGPAFNPDSELGMKYGPSNAQIRAAHAAGLSISRTKDQGLKRLENNYYGDGDYRSTLRNIGHWGSRIGGAGLGAIGGFGTGGIGGAVAGANMGWGGGQSFSKMMGWGDYNTPSVTNQIVGGSGASAAIPVRVNPGDLSGDVFISQREFIGNVTVPTATSEAFNVKTYELNPGLVQTFPFLSQIAKNFEMYELQGLGFQYVPTMGESSSASNNLGKVIMATNYDPSAPDFRSSVEMQNYDYANSAKPSLGMFHGVETATTKRATDLLYVREKSVPKDLVFTDIGKFQIATEGIAASGAADTMIIGELWITYRVRLTRSHLTDALGDTKMDVAVLTADALSACTSLVQKSSNSIIKSISSSSATRCDFVLDGDVLKPGMVVKIEYLNVGASVGSQTLFYGSVRNMERVKLTLDTGPVDEVKADASGSQITSYLCAYFRILEVGDSDFQTTKNVANISWQKVNISIMDFETVDGTATEPL